MQAASHSAQGTRKNCCPPVSNLPLPSLRLSRSRRIWHPMRSLALALVLAHLHSLAFASPIRLALEDDNQSLSQLGSTFPHPRQSGEQCV